MTCLQNVGSMKIIHRSEALILTVLAMLAWLTLRKAKNKKGLLSYVCVLMAFHELERSRKFVENVSFNFLANSARLVGSG